MKGIYILLIQLTNDTATKIGALGTRHFKMGYYAYIGSAQTNLEKRIKRHFKRDKRIFWHIDHLLDSREAKPVKVFVKEASKSEECAMATEFSRKNTPIFGFGCSDCHCTSHLFHIENVSSFLQDSKKLEINELNL